MKTSHLLTLCGLLTASPATAFAGFDWGGDCSEGGGDFDQFIAQGGITVIGEIPPGKLDIRIDLMSPTDVDVQLVDLLTGEEIIAWPNGLLSGPAEECAEFAGVTYCTSGYNGNQTMSGRGYEWIEIIGTSNRRLEMRAYGYEAGDAYVTYDFFASSTCNEIGDGSFAQWVPFDGFVDVGTIAAGKTNVSIDLVANGGRDVDVQLIDPATGLEIIAWPHGLLSGATFGSVEYDGVIIEYSGYNGVGGDWGHENITIWGETNAPLLMRSYGYEAGYANVDYRWGDGAGEACATDSGCLDGLYCKDDSQAPDAGLGLCHTADWCENDATADYDCATSSQGWGFGFFTCEQHQCVWLGATYGY